MTRSCNADQKKSIKKLLELIHEFSMTADYKKFEKTCFLHKTDSEINNEINIK